MPRGLLQRDAEMAGLSRRLAGVRAGAGRVIVVEGPAGIGKSSLLGAAARAAAEDGVRVLRAWGGPLEHEAGWGIARQLFAGLTPDAPGPARRALDAGSAEPAAAGDAMHAAAHGLVELARGLAGRGPVLLVVDDVHWADAPSLRWLVQLTRQIAELPLGILGAVRAGEPPAEPDLLADLLAAAPDPPIRPTPLGPAAVAAVVAGRLPTAGPSFADACHAATAGNPFLLGALLDHLAAEQVPPTDEVAARLGAFGPEQVGRAVERNLARLPAGATALARAFAVLGRDGPVRLARELAGLDPDEAARLTDRLCAAGLLRAGDGCFSLVHPLVAAALYQGFPAGERARWHSRAAALLAAERAEPEAVALHLLRGEPARDASTVDRLRIAAERAEQRGAPESAVAFLRRALTEPPPEQDTEAAVRGRLGLLLAAQVRPEARAELDAAVGLAAPADRPRIALAGARALGLAGYFDDALRLCRSALAQPDGPDPELLDRLEVELVCNAYLHVDGVAECRDRIRRRLPSGRPAWRIHAAWTAAADCCPVAEPLALLAPALDAAEHDSMLATVATLTVIICGDLDTAVARCTELIDIARPRAWLIALAHGSFLRSMALAQAGRVAEAEADARFAFEFKQRNSPPAALLWSAFPLVEALIERDEPEAAETVLRAVGDLPPGCLTTALTLERRARLRLAQHRPAEAHADLTAAAAIWSGLRMSHPGFAGWRVDDSRALVALGEPRAARELAVEHLALADRVGLPGPRAAGLRALAGTAGHEEAIPLLERAVALTTGGPARIEHVRALVELGAAMRRTNHRAAAREPLGRALDLAEPLGMRLLARRAREELRAAGARPRRSALAGVDALTPAERRVATLAAAGRSNREISQQLYVTLRTVETHLTHVFQKLGVAARSDLVAALPTGPPAGPN